MIREDIVNRVHERTGLEKQIVKSVVNAAIDEVIAAVERREDVVIRELGSLRNVPHHMKSGFTGDVIDMRKVRFTTSRCLRNKINKNN